MSNLDDVSNISNFEIQIEEGTYCNLKLDERGYSAEYIGKSDMRTTSTTAFLFVSLGP